jgi:ankyrin repeat protein
LCEWFLTGFLDGNNNTPLCIAAESGFREITEYLIMAHADPAVQGIDGMTPLHQAIFFQQAETCSLFLQNSRLAKKYINIPNEMG